MDAREYFQRRYSAFVPLISADNYLPGMMLDVEWPILNPFNDRYPENIEVTLGNFWELGLPMAPPALTEHDITIADTTVLKRFSLNAEATLKQFGLTVGLGLQSNYRVTSKITGTKAVMFAKGGTIFEIDDALTKLRRDDPRIWWERFNSHFMILSSFFVTEAQLAFTGDGRVAPKVALSQGNLNVDANVEITWQNESTLHVKGKPSVPFAVRGEKIDLFFAE